MQTNIGKRWNYGSFLVVSQKASRAKGSLRADLMGQGLGPRIHSVHACLAAHPGEVLLIELGARLGWLLWWCHGAIAAGAFVVTAGSVMNIAVAAHMQTAFILPAWLTAALSIRQHVVYNLPSSSSLGIVRLSSRRRKTPLTQRKFWQKLHKASADSCSLR